MSSATQNEEKKNLGLVEQAHTQLNLFGGSIVQVDSPELVRRYNSCLDYLGITKVELECFSIDALGWSPEIAELKHNPLYLSAGPANIFAIILSPNQVYSPLLLTSHSYDEDILETFYSKFKNQIADITTTDGITLDYDQGLSLLSKPTDLLLIDHVIIRTAIGELEQHIRQQQNLIRQFNLQKYAWFDEELRKKLLASANTYGDLRNRQASIDDIEHTFHSSHVLAFGGVFVLRSQGNKNPIIVLEDKSFKKICLGPKHRTFLPSDQELLATLEDYGFVAIDFQYYSKNLKLLELKRQLLIAKTLNEHYPEVLPSETSPGRIKQLLLQLGDKKLRQINELERVIRKVMRNQRVLPRDLSRELRIHLAEPKQNLPSSERKIIQRLLSRMNKTDILRLARSDPRYFSQEYMKWSESKQVWANYFLSETYATPKTVISEELL